MGWLLQSLRPGVAAALFLLLASCGAAERTSADRFTRNGELIALSGGDAGAAYACFTCHGLDGRGDGAGAPHLAGLGLGYLNRQLEVYATGRLRHPAMELIAKRLRSEEHTSELQSIMSKSYAVLCMTKHNK